MAITGALAALLTAEGSPGPTEREGLDEILAALELEPPADGTVSPLPATRLELAVEPVAAIELLCRLAADDGELSAIEWEWLSRLAKAWEVTEEKLLEVWEAVR